MIMNRNNTTKMGKGSNENGFTLIEVIVAISILTFGILAIASMQISSIRGNSFASGTTEGTTLAGDELERLMTLPWDNPLLQDTDGDAAAGLNDTDFDDDPTTQDDADHQASEDSYTIYWNIADDTPITNIKTLNITVTWMDHGAQKSVSLQRVIPRII
jgi:type IV pilus assembly protein PilV